MSADDQGDRPQIKLSAPLGAVLGGRLRACWHILRGRRVIYGVAINSGEWFDRGWQADLMWVGCRFLAGTVINGVPALECQTRFGDIRVKSLPRLTSSPP